MDSLDGVGYCGEEMSERYRRFERLLRRNTGFLAGISSLLDMGGVNFAASARSLRGWRNPRYGLYEDARTVAADMSTILALPPLPPESSSE